MLDDAGIRPPIIAAGINLFGGPLGLIHKHVTGAIPIRRNTKDPAYLITLKAYVAELLQQARPVLLSGRRPQLQRRAEGAEDRTVQRARCSAERAATWSIVPVAVAYDLVLEDHILARQRVKRRQRPFSRELAEMVRYAVGYRSRARSSRSARRSPLDGIDAESRTRRARADAPWCAREIGRLYKVLPTAVLAAAMRPSITRRDLESRIDRADRRRCAARHANLGVTSGRRGRRRGRRAARDPRHHRRRAAAGSASASATCCATTRGRSSTCWRRPAARTERRRRCSTPRRRPSSISLAQSRHACKRLASRYGMRRPTSFARRFIAGETVEEAIEAARDLEAAACCMTLDYLGESVATLEEADAATPRLRADHRRDRRSPASSATSR